MRERAREGLAILPSLLTLGNMLCGFYAIVHVASVQWNAGLPSPERAFQHATIAILLAMVFDMLDAFLPDRVRYWQARLANAVCTVLVGVTAWFVFNRAMRSASMGDTTAQLLVPVAPFHYAAAVLLVVCAFMHLYLAVTGKGRR